jgi:hypothetical protein
MGWNKNDELALLLHGPSSWPVRAHGSRVCDGIKSASQGCSRRRCAVLPRRSVRVPKLTKVPNSSSSLQTPIRFPPSCYDLTSEFR